MFRKSLKLLAAGVAAFGLAASTPALAWGDLGHRTIANIALANVSPKTKAAIETLCRRRRGWGRHNARSIRWAMRPHGPIACAVKAGAGAIHSPGITTMATSPRPLSI